MLDVLPGNSVEFQDSALEYWLKFFITDKKNVANRKRGCLTSLFLTISALSELKQNSDRADFYFSGLVRQSFSFFRDFIYEDAFLS